jgi:hypothetical protein
VVRVDFSRQEFIYRLRRAGLNELADTAEATLPNPLTRDEAVKFCMAHGLSTSMLMDLMGASP